MSGTPAKGKTLRCEPGTWTGEPVLTYQWLVDGAVARGRTDTTYRVRGHDVGRLLACRVTARNAGGTATATSEAVPGARAAREFGLPSGKACIAASKLKLRLRAPRALAVKSLGLYVDGNRRLALPARSLPAVVWVRRLPSKRFSLGVRALQRNGGWQRASQAYRRCSA